LLIEQNGSLRNSLNNKTILLTGGGGGIGLETAKALSYMGANIILAEIDKNKLNNAKQVLRKLNFNTNIEYYKINLASEREINRMVNYILKKYVFIDVLLNNAAIAFVGNVENISLNSWEESYKVNFKAPLILTQKIVPLMKNKNVGIIVFISSSGSAPYLGAYEVFKTAQVELANTLYGEFENTNLSVFTISPGLVKTETAIRSIEIISNKMGIPVNEFYEMNKDHILTAEEAGLGFALSILKSIEYNGKEIGSIQVLNDFEFNKIKQEKYNKIIDDKTIEIIKIIIQKYNEQYLGWMKRNIFERQWVLRDFKKTTGMAADECQIKVNKFMEMIDGNTKLVLAKLRVYFERQYNLLQGFEKDPVKLKEHSNYLKEYINNLETVIKIL
jgi:NADP-dependent 3-hydroxy acid dehydrogenase YdfG